MQSFWIAEFLNPPYKKTYGSYYYHIFVIAESTLVFMWRTPFVEAAGSAFVVSISAFKFKSNSSFIEAVSNCINLNSYLGFYDHKKKPICYKNLRDISRSEIEVKFKN